MAAVHQEFHESTSQNVSNEALPTTVVSVSASSSACGIMAAGPTAACSLSPFVVHMNLNEISQAEPGQCQQKRRKCADDWTSRYGDEFVVSTIQRSDAVGGVEHVLVCRFCKHKITPRSDRVKEHLSSKKHNTNKEIAGQFPVATNVSQKLQQVVSTAASSKRSSRNPVPAMSLPKIQILDAATSNASFHAGEIFHSLGANNYQNEKQVLISLEPSMGIGKSLLRYYLTGQFSDVTLMCDGSMIKCHKIILASFSMYFEEVLVEPQMSNAVICLSCVRLTELKGCLELMYNGEVNIQAHQLPQLLVAMDRLGIKSVIKDSPQACVDFAKLWSAISTGVTGPGTNTTTEGRGQIPMAKPALHLLPSKGAGKAVKKQTKKSSPKLVSILTPILPEACQQAQVVRRKATRPRKLTRKGQPTPTVHPNYFKEFDGLNPLDIVQATFSDAKYRSSESRSESETDLKIDEDARPPQEQEKLGYEITDLTEQNFAEDLL